MVARLQTRGLSLLEAVVALVFLSGATLTVVGLFHTGLRQQAQGDDRILAAGLAQRQLEELRHNALTITGYELLYSLDGIYRPDAVLPQFQVALTSYDANLISPCSAFGELHNPPVSEPTRTLTGSARWVWVGVQWAGVASSLRLAGMVSQPISTLDNPPRVEVAAMAPPANPIPHDGQAQFQATLYDSRGVPIRAERFKFFTPPKTAAPTLRPFRDGITVQLENQLTPPSFPPTALAHPASTTYDSGTTVITASGRYFGQPVIGHSAPMQLAP